MCVIAGAPYFLPELSQIKAQITKIRATIMVSASGSIFKSPVVGRQYPLLPPVTGQALDLSRGADRDNPAGDAVGLLCLGSVGSKPNDLFSVGALAQCAQCASHVFRGLSWAN